MVETCNNQASSHVKVPYRTNQIQRGLPRNRQDHPKRPKNAKWVIFKRDGSLDTPFSRLWQRFNVFWIPHMSGFLLDLMKPVRDNQDYKGAVRNVKKYQKRVNKIKKGDFQRRRQSLHTFLMVLGETTIFWIPHMSG
jgi:hypothetical protein